MSEDFLRVSQGRSSTAYGGIGSVGPFALAAATPAAPIIMGSLRYTGKNKLYIRSLDVQNFASVAFSAANLITFALRKVEAYASEDTGGTDVTAFFGARKSSSLPPVTGFSVRVASSSAGLGAGTRVLLNPIAQNSFYVANAAVGALPGYSRDFAEPIEIMPGEGVEFVTLLATADATVRLGKAISFDWFELPLNAA